MFRTTLPARATLAVAATLVAAVATPAAASPRPPHAGTTRTAPSHSDIVIDHIDSEPASAGASTTVHILLANHGPEPAASPFTVTVVLPPTTAVDAVPFPDACTVDSTLTKVTCTFPAGLGVLRTAVTLVSVRIPAATPPATQLTGGSATVTSPDNVDGPHAVDFSVQTT
ncbi:hypothetical protein AB0C76_39715 [Kitasatospora sp. NPDC048722]|uniref:hypothetical protein n=1 Tax=Kitasatospora sp. NPDC048722 TaxID=3155639 RepID=UPI00340731A2